jgi:hypothetical protein
MPLTAEERRLLAWCAELRNTDVLHPHDFNAEAQAILERLMTLRLIGLSYAHDPYWRTYYVTDTGRKELAAQ